ncbi:MAG: hypothetical protein M3Q07_06440 [Pseudobdellovibrionaceae bacterium]|nr:hypothetical protein [Pseudobdellovibrionaceae bacterium]
MKTRQSSRRTVEHKINDFIDRQVHIDLAARPDALLLEQSPEAYAKAWKEYVAQTRENVQEFKDDLNYYPSMAEEKKARKEAEEAKDPAKRVKRGRPIGNGKLQSQSAKDAFTRAAKKLKSSSDAVAPHFNRELNNLAQKYKRFAKYLKALPRHPDAFSRAVEELKDTLPEKLIEKLFKLPYKHPARFYMHLPKSHNKALSKQKAQTRSEAHKNAPTIALSDFQDFAISVYQRRYEADWQELYIACLIISGRRKVDLGYVSEFTASEREGHIIADTLSKKRLVFRPETGTMERPIINLNFPVVPLEPEQALEMIQVLRTKIRNEVVGDENWLEIKRTGNSSTFDGAMASVRYTFKKHFPIQVIIPPQRKKDGSFTPEKIIRFNVHKICRAAYIRSAEIEFSHKPEYKGLSPLGFANTILGHESQDLMTTADYLAIRVQKEPDQPAMPYTAPEVAKPQPWKPKTILQSPEAVKAYFNPKFEKAFLKFYLKHKDANILILNHYIKANIEAGLTYEDLAAKAGAQKTLETFLEYLNSQGIHLNLYTEVNAK